MTSKNLTVAFLYNVRHKYPDPNDVRTQLETDFDDPSTIETFINHLKECGYDVLPIEANEDAYLRLYESREKIDIAFNYAEGIYGKSREAQIPAMLEMLQIPYTGSSPLTQALVLDKARAKQILSANNIPVLPSQLFANSKEELRDDFTFPLIVKPNAQGSSAGITNNSIVDNQKDLKKQIDFVTQTFNQQAIVEPYLDGREFSVAMLGNPPKILGIIEPDHSLLPDNLHHIDSFEVKWIFEEETSDNYLTCPAIFDEDLKGKVEDICFKTWKALDIQDWCRIDLRCDKNNNPFFLEVNSPPGCIPPEVSLTSYFPLAARTAGLDYPVLLKTIINHALKRYQTKNETSN